MTWRVGLLAALAFTGGVLVLLAIVTRPIAPTPHEIFVNGHILTMDAVGTIAEAVSVLDGRVEAIGRSAALLAGRGQRAIEQSLKNLEQSAPLEQCVELVAIERQGDGLRQIDAAG